MHSNGPMICMLSIISLRYRIGYSALHITLIMMEVSYQLIKCILAEFYGSTGYKAEVVESSKFEIDKMDARWEDIFGFAMKDDSEGSWDLTACEVEPLFEISYKDDKWCWQTGRRLWFNDCYKLMYNDCGECKTLEEAMEAAINSFESLTLSFEVTDLEDIDDTL